MAGTGCVRLVKLRHCITAVICGGRGVRGEDPRFCPGHFFLYVNFLPICFIFIIFLLCFLQHFYRTFPFSTAFRNNDNFSWSFRSIGFVHTLLVFCEDLQPLVVPREVKMCSSPNCEELELETVEHLPGIYLDCRWIYVL